VTLKELVSEYNGKVRVVFKNLVVHPQQVARAHLGGCAAAKQGKFAAYYDAFWDKSFGPYSAARDPSKLSEETIMSWAPAAGLDVAKLKADMDSPDCQKLLASDAGELQKFQVNSTPTLFINGIHIGGALPKESFKQIIDERLKIVEQSGVNPAEFYDKKVMGEGVPQFRSKAESGGGGGGH
jgi:protein-disulfide isomerase